MNWKLLPPTEKQQIAVHTYEQWYGIKIPNLTKQSAHDVISKFMEERTLSFKDGYIVGTTVKCHKAGSNLSSTHYRTDIRTNTPQRNVDALGTIVGIRGVGKAFDFDNDEFEEKEFNDTWGSNPYNIIE